MRGDDAEATGLAPTPADPTELAGLVDYPTESAYAWAEDLDDEPTVRLTPKRITVLAVAASMATLTGVGVLAFVKLRSSDPIPVGQPSVAAPVPITPIPPAVPKPPPVALNGVYEFTYDWRNTTTRNTGKDVEWDFTHAKPREWIAFSTTCTPAECIATGNPLTEDRRTPMDVGPLILRLHEGAWEDMAPRTQAKPCRYDNGELAAESLITQDLALTPRPDATHLEGRLRTVASSEGCGDAGNTALTPVTANLVNQGKRPA